MAAEDLEPRLRQLELAEAARCERDKKIDDIHDALCGEGDDPGLVVRVDRIEQRHSTFEKLVAGTLAILGTLAAFLGIKWSQ